MQLVIDKNIINVDFIDNTESNQTVLILPGWLRNASEWSEIGTLLNYKYKVITVDFPGFGISPKPVKDFDIFDYSNLIIQLLEKLNVSKCIVIGHSFGGRVALILAATTNLVQKLVLVDSAGLQDKSLSTSFKLLLARMLGPVYRVLPKRLAYTVRNLVGSSDYNNAGDMRACFVKIVNQHLNKYLENINVDTLIIWGNNDKVLPVFQTKILRQEIKNSQVRIVWGAGHSPHLENPAKFREIVEEYLC